MAKKSLGYVQLVWTCPRCETRNPGPQKFCNGCGAPQPPNVEFEQPPEEKLITDQSQLAQAKLGPDIHCPYCAARNPGNAKFCGACGGELAGGEKRQAGKILGGHRAEPAKPIVCPSCGAQNPADASRCANCGGSLAAPRAQPEAVGPAPKARRPAALGIGLALGLVVCLGAAGALLLLTSRTQDVVGQVQQVEWTRSIAVEALQEVESEGWWDEIPSDAYLGTCSYEYRETRTEPAPYATEVCGAPYTVDTGSGYGEVVQDCVYEVYDEWCRYAASEWTVVDTLVNSGDDLVPLWPSAQLASGQRLGAEDERYRVLLFTPDGQIEYQPADEAEFSAFTPGSEWVLEVNALGNLVSVQPAP